MKVIEANRPIKCPCYNCNTLHEISREDFKEKGVFDNVREGGYVDFNCMGCGVELSIYENAIPNSWLNIIYERKRK